MEDVRKRLEFDNTGVQLQAVNKLYEAVQTKKPPDEIISSSTPEFAELRLLWQYTIVEQHVVARSACQVWMELVHENAADVTYVLNGLLNMAPSAKNLQGIVEGIGHIVSLQAVLKCQLHEPYVCPYSIRSPPHPFISIFTTRPDTAWPLLLEQVLAILTHPDNRIADDAIAILEPFVKFVLLEPARSDQYSAMRQALMNALISTISQLHDTDHKRRLFAHLVDILHAQQTSSLESTAEMSQHCQQLLQTMATNPTIADTLAASQLASVTLSLCRLCVRYNIGFTALAQQLLLIGQTFPKILQDEVNLCQIAGLMRETYPPDNIVLLNIVEQILTTEQDFNRYSVGLVTLATVNILATPKSVTIGTKHKMLMSLANKVMTLVEGHISKDMPSNGRTDPLSSHVSTDGYESRSCIHLARLFTQTPQALAVWLHNLHEHIVDKSSVNRNLTSLLASILLVTKDTSVSLLAIARLVDIAKTIFSEAPSILPLLLYTLGKKTCPTLRLGIMGAVPKVATHKVCVAPVLKTIQSLGTSPKLKALSIRLLTELWALQDRCFPHLLRVITEASTGSTTIATMVDDVTLAKAAAIKHVCRLRPEQHGADMLGPLSEILNTCTGDEAAPAAALALEGLAHLCGSEVIDIQSAWAALQGRLTKETRPVVVEKICDLFALVPSLQVSTEEYQVFLAETVQRLWLYTQTDNNRVVSAAFHALATFSVGQFKVSHLQYDIVEDFVRQARAAIDDQEAEDSHMTIDDVLPSVPGVCYIRLMKQLHDSDLKGYETFLSSMVADEVQNLPRGIYYSALRQNRSAANHGRLVSAIPGFIQSQYELTKQPGLRPGLAAGLLFCYEPPQEVGRDGRPRKHYVLTHGKNFQQMFETLLHEVPVQPCDLHMTVLMPHAWSHFTESLFTSMLQARRAEIELQLSRDHIDEQECGEKMATAWLWVRDRIVEMIKSASRCSPSIQCNSVLALAGLATTIQRYMMSLDANELKLADAATEYASHAHWTMVVIDTFMSLVDVTYKPKGSLLGLCQQRSADDRLPASVLAQSAAFISLATITPIIISSCVELVHHILTMAMAWLPRKQGSEDAPVLQLWRGLGLGMMLAGLTQEWFSDVAGSEGSLAMMKAMDALEECCLSRQHNRSGALLGLGLSLSALCHEGKTESRAHVTSMHTKLLTTLQGLNPSDAAFETHCICVAMVTGSGFSTNTIDHEAAEKSLECLQNLHRDNQQSPGVSTSLGMVSYSLAQSGHSGAHNVKVTLLDGWLTAVNKQDTNKLEKVASLHGVMALVGSERILTQMGNGTISAADPNVDKIIDLANQHISHGDDLGFQGNTAWLLGHLYMSLCTVTHSSSAVPSSYGYLPESSILRAVTDFLIEAGKLGPEGVPNCHVHSALVCLREKVTHTLPPLNWAGVLSPLMRLGFDDGVKHVTLQLAVKICGTATTAAMFLSSWIVPPLFTTLPEHCQNLIFHSLGASVKSVTPAVLQVFLGRCCKEAASSHMVAAVLSGHRRALTLPDPPEAVSALLFQSIVDLFELLETTTQPKILRLLSACLGHLPEKVFDEIVSSDCKTAASIYRGTFVRCYLVGNGFQPIALLNSCLDAAFNQIHSGYNGLLWLLLHCFIAMTTCGSEQTRVMRRLQWLSEIMGHVCNIATGTTHLTVSPEHLQKVLEFALNIIAGAVCTWTSNKPAAVFGLKSNLLILPQSHDVTDWTETDHMTEQDDSDSLLDGQLTIPPIEHLPVCIQGLSKEPWSQILPKMLDWLLVMRDLPSDLLTDHCRQHLHDAVLSLRQCADFRKISVWTRVVLTRRGDGQANLKTPS